MVKLFVKNRVKTSVTGSCATKSTKEEWRLWNWQVTILKLNSAKSNNLYLKEKVLENPGRFRILNSGEEK